MTKHPDFQATPPEPELQEYGIIEQEMTLQELLNYYDLTLYVTENGDTLIINKDGTPLIPLHRLWRKL